MVFTPKPFFPRENQKKCLKGGFLVFPRKQLVFLPKTIFFPGKSWFFLPKPSFSQEKLVFRFKTCVSLKTVRISFQSLLTSVSCLYVCRCVHVRCVPCAFGAITVAATTYSLVQ